MPRIPDHLASHVKSMVGSPPRNNITACMEIPFDVLGNLHAPHSNGRKKVATEGIAPEGEIFW